jgi:glyceraldehyde 3-phosphate dehydrogenase
MAVRVAINGFGRIGRLVLRAAYEHKNSDIEVVGINDLGPVETNAHLLRYDSVHGRFPGEVTTGDNWMDIGRGKIRVTAERDPAKLPWRSNAPASLRSARPQRSISKPAPSALSYRRRPTART